MTQHCWWDFLFCSHPLTVQAMKDEYSRNPSPKLLKDIQEAKKHIPQLQGQLFRATSATQVKTKKPTKQPRPCTCNQNRPLWEVFYQPHPTSLCVIWCVGRPQTNINPNLIKGLGFSAGSHSFVSA